MLVILDALYGILGVRDGILPHPAHLNSDTLLECSSFQLVPHMA